MKMPQIPTPTVSLILAGAISLALCGSASSQSGTRERAQVLLDEVKKRDLESQLALKRTEVQRLNEDLEKREKEAAALEESIGAISNVIGETDSTLEQLSERKKHVSRVLELTSQRIEAERLKRDGLKTLSDAQAKSRERASQQIQETTIRAGVANAELGVLTDKQAVQDGNAVPRPDAEKLNSEIAELKKKLAKSERNTATASRAAREAMSAASSKLLQADNAGAKAKKTASDWGLDEEVSASSEKLSPEPVALPPLKYKK